MMFVNRLVMYIKFAKNLMPLKIRYQFDT